MAPAATTTDFTCYSAPQSVECELGRLYLPHVNLICPLGRLL